MNTKILLELGFTKGEIKVYLALVKLGNTTSGPIVDESGISKSKVYEILERLSKKGIVSQIIEDKVKHFQAVNPRKLIELYNEKEEKLKGLKEKLIEIMPELESKYKSIKEKQETTVLRGYSGLKVIFNDVLDILKESEEYLVFCAVEPPKFFQAFLYHWSKERIKKKIYHKIIYNMKVSKEHLNSVKEYKYTKVKRVFPEFDTSAVFNLYSNKTAIILWAKKPICILIENREITNSFRKYFNLLWKIAKK